MECTHWSTQVPTGGLGTHICVIYVYVVLVLCIMVSFLFLTTSTRVQCSCTRPAAMVADSEDTLSELIDEGVTGLIFNASALIDYKQVLWRVWKQVCDCHSNLTITDEIFNLKVFESSPQDIIQYMIEASATPSLLNASEVYLSYVKFYERALVDAQDIQRVECVCSIAKKYHKMIPMAVISNEKYEDIIQLMTHMGILHMFDVVIAQEGESSSQQRCSQVQMYCQAAQRLKQRVDTCFGFDHVDSNLAFQREAGRRMFDVKTLQPAAAAFSCNFPNSSTSSLQKTSEERGPNYLFHIAFYACGVVLSMYYYINMYSNKS